MVRCEEAASGLYGQRDAEVVLHLIDQAEQLAGPHPTFWTAHLAGTKSKALTILGRHDEAKKALNIFMDWSGEDARGRLIPISWRANQPHFAASWVYAGAGDEGAADIARDQVLSHRPDYQYAANVRLHEALCTVVKKGVDRGVQQAATLLDSMEPAYRSQMISETGKMVLNAVPSEQWERPAVREFREVLSRTMPENHAAAGR